MRWVAHWLGCSLALLTSLGTAAERMPALTPDQMSPAQRQVADAIQHSRGNLSGPFMPWLRSPELAQRLQTVGEYVRYQSALPVALREFVILITAHEWHASLEWSLHYPQAVAAGVEAKMLAQLAAGRRPASLSHDQALLYDFCDRLHRHHGDMQDAQFEAVRSRFGDQGVIDLIGLVGYYDLVAMTINATAVAASPARAGPGSVNR